MATSAVSFPRRDWAGRVASLPEFIVAAALATIGGLVAVVVIDALFALVRLGEFGQASGWLAAVLPGLLFFEDVRAWRAARLRFVVAGLAGVLALGVGGLASAVVAAAPPMVAGAVGALTAAVSYSLFWFVGIRWLGGRDSEKE